MKTNLNPGETQGIYEVTERAYERSNTAVQFFDFPAKDGITVGYVLGEFTERQWHRYNMTDGGVGCRWWILTVMQGLAQYCLRDPDSIEDVLAVNLQYSWHRNNPPIALPIQKGTFF
ncbi:hypothetical protein K469DRAFT_714916 [Zopfia rhizophila CBS 207.26]|uniref:DUF7770 domain-containing protein n=1 Tax=Zopfia rhizophila CBS 207.26 TaxID=1314779 RepID=A0A6A6ENX9_9PEZI|nr:hypothetical protein K469DRAFT_714916 [Zopfia rhizophila CBS 207.26]